ncbi:hypothetical protein AVEN_8276-1 [Araneus ventricosus]|uniref:Uncharacterized protein n=1 Tax=Araneus ventricosus TaxID=182803 RepID=A0A4Y2FFA5_ARAVE|nr:hypothetical protein AVEN_8276-1 [Araneus ventricosus]
MKLESVMVTGANRGLGLEFVRQLSRLSEPPKYVFATYRSPDSLKNSSPWFNSYPPGSEDNDKSTVILNAADQL